MSASLLKSNMKLDYKVEEVGPNIFVVLLKDSYHLPMLFCRVQEFYESPNDDFRGKYFSIWDYMEWYANNGIGSFTYPSDWGGFNIPYPILKQCVDLHFIQNQMETPYDVAMYEIFKTLELRNQDNMYIIGTQNNSGSTFNHEICHGLFYTNTEYREKALSFVRGIDEKALETFKSNLLKNGYTETVVEDEVHAYLMFGHTSNIFSDGLESELVSDLHDKIYELLGDWLAALAPTPSPLPK
jgi:hypothetical protein